MPAQVSEHPAPALLRALGDPVRFKLFGELPSEDKAEIPVGELGRRLGVSDTVVSQHLRVLSGIGLVGHHRSGRVAHYYVKAAAVRAAREVLARLVAAACGGAASQSSASPSADQVTGNLTVLAAASLTDSFNKIGEQFKAKHSGADVKFSYAGSPTLVTQIQQGAPADVFAS